MEITMRLDTWGGGEEGRDRDIAGKDPTCPRYLPRVLSPPL